MKLASVAAQKLRNAAEIAVEEESRIIRCDSLTQRDEVARRVGVA